MANPTWRGVTVCTCMPAPLDELAARSGNDILVSPIPGFGSFQVGVTASAGTGRGGGHVDLSLTRLNTEQKLRLEGLARQIGFYADIREPQWWSPTRRKWLRAKWQSHLHMVLKDCPHRSPEAIAQVKEWFAGENGLAGDDPDDGDRRFLNQTFAQYLAAKKGIAPAVADARSIQVRNLHLGLKNDDVKRYQGAAWHQHGPAFRAGVLKEHNLQERQITDGFYGKVTQEITAALYSGFRRAEPKGGWPQWTEPGPRLLKRLGFVPVGTRDLDTEGADEFDEPVTAPGPDDIIDIPDSMD